MPLSVTVTQTEFAVRDRVFGHRPSRYPVRNSRVDCGRNVRRIAVVVHEIVLIRTDNGIYDVRVVFILFDDPLSRVLTRRVGKSVVCKREVMRGVVIVIDVKSVFHVNVRHLLRIRTPGTFAVQINEIIRVGSLNERIGRYHFSVVVDFGYPDRTIANGKRYPRTVSRISFGNRTVGIMGYRYASVSNDLGIVVISVYFS